MKICTTSKKREKLVLVFLVIMLGFFVSNAPKALAATLYYVPTVNTDWGNLGNWWTDSAHTSPSPSLPELSDDVILYGSVESNSANPVSINTLVTYGGNYSVIGIPMTVTNGAILNEVTQLAKTFRGDVTVNDKSYIYAGEVMGRVIFNDNSQLYYATVEGDVVFNDFSHNEGTVIGNAVFNGDRSENNLTISGTKTRRYSTDTVTTRNFNLNGPWRVLADGAVVDVSGVSYGNDTVFETQNGGSFIGAPQVPTVETISATVSKKGVTFSGSILDTGLPPGQVMSRGFYYGLSPSYGSAVTESAGPYATGNFSGFASNLACGSTYYFQAFAQNMLGVGRGGEQTFTTGKCTGKNKKL